MAASGGFGGDGAGSGAGTGLALGGGAVVTIPVKRGERALVRYGSECREFVDRYWGEKFQREV